MRTARALTVSPSMLCSGGGGGVCSGVSAPRGVYSGGCLLWGVSALVGLLRSGGGSTARGGVVSAPEGGVCSRGSALGGVSQHALRQTPPLLTERRL